MIVLDIVCGGGHRFEGWFANGQAFDDQRARKLVACPLCADVAVERALSAPRIGGARSNTSDERAQVVAKLAGLQREMLKGSTWVGDSFATRARAMADGDEPKATIHGQATVADAKALHDDGVGVLPLPFPVVPPEQCN